MTVRMITPRTPASPMTEADLQDSVIGLCKWLHLLVYHTRDSRGSHPGFPDLVIVGRRVIFRELKTDTGEMRRSQTVWAEGLAESLDDLCDPCFSASQVPPVFEVWRPSDWRKGIIREQLELLTFTAGHPRRPR